MASKTHFVCLHVLGLILFVVLAVVVSGDEFYGILGVSRSANNDEIRKAYRRLAREWHPDKNTNSNAQEKFIKINEAYETLSDPKKREDYDRYGESGAPSQWQREHEFFQDSGFMYFNGMPFQFQSNWRHQDFTTLNYFKKTILPDSFKKPYLLQIVSDWCINCAAVEEIWEYSSMELKSLGLGTGRVNRNIDPQLAKELGARKLPDFVGVISGKIYHYSGTVATEKLRDFVGGLFPNNLVPEVTNSTLDQFLYYWYDNMPRALLFTTKTAPPLLLKIVSFKYQDNVRVGYLQLTKPGNSETREKFGAEKDEPTFAIFKENTSQPDILMKGSELKSGTLDEVLSQNLYLHFPRISSETIFERWKGSELKSGTLDEVLSQNLYLHFPRISSETIFEKLCPQEAILSQRSLCVILFTNTVPYRPKQHPFLTMSRDRAWLTRKVRFAYVHQEQQRSFENSIKMTEKTRSVCGDKTMSKKVAILWHVKKRDVKYSWLENGWCGPKDVARLTAKLNRILAGKVKLELSAVVGELNNEHGKHFLSWLLDLWNDLIYYSFYYVNWSGNLPTLSLVMTLGFVFIISCLFPSISEKDSNLKANEEDQHPSTANDAFGLIQLNSQNQDKFIHRAKQGQLLVVLLSDATSQSQAVRSPIVQIFSDITRLYLRENIFIFGWLSIQDHIAWCNEVMKVQTFGQIKPGTVLAINGAKKYLSIFKVQRQLKNDYDAGNIFDDSEDEDTEASSMVFQEDKRTQKRIAEALGRQLPTWLEKLFEGMVSRVKLDNWPRMECDK